ncbi:MAG: AarF/ABC1/UbiB kinase family protein [Nanoarchaeota archaeon]|nr:AarF/ABC1/UbiB kinase family protein [Nanoarchaeota archaeon]
MDFKTAFRDFKRIKEISGVLFKQGLGYYVHKMKLKHHLFLSAKEKKNKLSEPKNVAENLRRAMDELGPTFVKIGQFLSLRPDLIPESYCKEFSKLQDDVSEIPFKEVKKIVETELKLKLTEVFSVFNEEPIASASIGQVHKARLLNGEAVVVKVQRPKIKPVIEADIDILYYLADLAKKHIEALKNYNLREVVKEFERYTKEELDYLKEGRNIDRFYSNFTGDETVKIPKIYHDFTTSTVLTMGHIKGVNVDDKDGLKEKGCTEEIVAANLADCFLKQVFEFGFFHADPHPANVFVLENNVVALLDYGIVGKLSDEHREKLTNIMMKLVRRDLEGVLDGFLALGMIEDGDKEGLKHELNNMLEEYAGTSIQEVNVPKLFEEFLDIASKYSFKIPKDLVLLGKAIITIEGVGQGLYPGFNLSRKLSEYVEEVEIERKGVVYLMKKIGGGIKSYSDLIFKMPKQTSRILEKLEEGELKVEFQHKELDNLEREIDRGSNRVALSVLIAALVVASSLTLNMTGSKFFSILGFTIALILSLFLAISIYNERTIRV